MVTRRWSASSSAESVHVDDYADPGGNKFGVWVRSYRTRSEAWCPLSRAQLRSLGEWALRVAGPEPPPVDADGDVLAEVILSERLRMHRLVEELDGNEDRYSGYATIDRSEEEISAKLIEFLHQRREFGLAKYGKPLARENGRDHLRDALDELLDAMAYAHASREWDFYESARGAAIVAIRKMQEVEQ